MSKRLIINLIDKLFISVCIFLTIFAWINFYTRNIWTSFILSLIFSFACLFLLFFFLSKKNDKILKSKKEIENVEKHFLAFRLMNTRAQLEFFLKILKDFNPTIKNGIITYIQNYKKYAIVDAINISNFEENDFLNVLQIVKDLDVSEIEIICSSFSRFNTKILNTKNFTLTNKEKLYKNYFEKYNQYPDAKDILKPSTKTKFIDILSNFFLPHKAKSYFLCGLVLIFSSIILPFHNYYIIFGSILLIFAVICKIKKSISD